MPEPRASATFFDASIISGDGGVAKIMDNLDKAYDFDSKEQFDIDISSFLDNIRTYLISVEKSATGFHVRMEKILEVKLKYSP